MSRAAQPLYVRMADAPALFGLSRDTLERRAKEGCFTIRRVGAASLVSVEEVRAWIEASTLAPRKVGARLGAGESA